MKRLEEPVEPEEVGLEEKEEVDEVDEESEEKEPRRWGREGGEEREGEGRLRELVGEERLAAVGGVVVVGTGGRGREGATSHLYC
jgi:hypothetical protein